MPTGNPLEQFRRRMQSHATPTAFAALAEEHRRAGRLAEAVAVCREGLERYPAYVSARVTLGRALLDSGDAPGAVTELEHAVAQSPDNLAAARALETARAALGDTPWPPAPAADAAADLPLRASDDDTPSASPSVMASALSTGPDAPQEFGLGPDWSLPDAPPPLPVFPPPLPTDDSHSEPIEAYAEWPEMAAGAEHAQGEEPAGIWPVPADPSTEDAASLDGDQAGSWSVEPASSDQTVVWSVEDRAEAEAATEASASVWGDLTIEVPAGELAEAEVLALSPDLVPDPALVTSEAVADAPLEEESSSFWMGAFGGEAVAEKPAPFAGWGEDAPPTAAEADRSPWAGDTAADDGAWTTPDGPSATWALGDLTETEGADATPFQGALDEEDPRPEPFANLAEPAESVWADAPAARSEVPLPAMPVDAAASLPTSVPGGMPEPLWTESADDDLELGLESFQEEFPVLPDLPELPPIPVDAPDPAFAASSEPAQADAAWSGSVKSALGEVFALAGQGDSLEPPVHPSPVVREAMADAAVDAAREDAALREDGPPVLASLEQMLAAVRARRAALSGSLDS